MAVSRVCVKGDRFVDLAGREIRLRGVNLGGDCKIPFHHGDGLVSSDFSDHRQVSFIGRPFPLAEADGHLARLRHWGFNCLRLLTTWEAIEHAGPGLYDETYLDYLAEICRLAGQYDLYVFIDFHQDVWSRMTGGDGAPGWTLEAAGIDMRRLHAAGAAHVMQAKFDYADPNPHQAAYPSMSWGGNYRLPANGIMWSLFWGGEVLTPDFKVGGRNIQRVLQDAYLACVDQVARRICHLPNVLGFDTLNEPGLGWIGEHLNHRHLAPTADNPVAPRIGPALSPLDGLAIAAGLTVRVPLLKRNLVTGRAEPSGDTVINPDGVKIWVDGMTCPFEQAGAYRRDGDALQPIDEDFFRRHEGQALNVYQLGFRPLFHKVAQTIRAHREDWSVFAEIDPFGGMTGLGLPQPMPERSVNASHWYDVRTLYLKAFRPEGDGDHAAALDATRARYVRELGVVKAAAAGLPGGGPTLIGEFGIPYDMEGGKAYADWREGRQDSGVWRPHVEALSLMYDALDELGLHATQWNYTASNRNDLRIGDGWNQEDLSIFSTDQQADPDDPDSGGRGIEGFCRPFAQAVAGRVSDMRFDRARGIFSLQFDADGQGETVVYVPQIQFPNGIAVSLEGAATNWTLAGQRLTVTAVTPGSASVKVSRL